MMEFPDTFYSKTESSLMSEFFDRGYVIRDAARPDLLEGIRGILLDLICALVPVPTGTRVEDALNHFHRHISLDQLNSVRMNIYQQLNANNWFRPTYFELGRPYLEALIGNELAMQNRVNLSIQLPNDESSLLGIHADCFSGESPYQFVLWIPLVDVYDTKAMFFLDWARNREVVASLQQYRDRGMEFIYKMVEKDLTWIKVNYGQILIFTPNILHGNIVNREPETRWSFNCRFKGLFTPYSDHPGSEKSLGGFYLPITPRAATKVGLSYTEPSGF